MRILLFIGLLVIGVVLFLAKKWISDDTLQRLADAFAIVALVAAALVFVVPAPVPPESTPTETPLQMLLPTSTSTPSAAPLPTNIPTPSATPVPTNTNPPPTPTKLPISSLNRLTILSLFKIPRETLTSVDRLDTIIRPSRSSSIVIIPNYPLLPQYTLDDYGYISENGQAINISPYGDIGKYLDIDYGTWRNYLGVFDFVIPADETIQFCGFYTRSEVGGLEWQDAQRFIYSADIGVNNFKIERVSWVEIKDCSNTPIVDWAWARKNAEGAAASTTTDSVYYWDKVSNSWVKLK